MYHIVIRTYVTYKKTVSDTWFLAQAALNCDVASEKSYTDLLILQIEINLVFACQYLCLE